MSTTEVIQKAIKELKGERNRLDMQIQTLEGVVSTWPGAKRPLGVSKPTKAAEGANHAPRKWHMSTEARLAVSRRMKARWAKYRAEKAKAQRKSA